MTLLLEKVDPAFAGVVPLHGARNGLAASGRLVRTLARAANFLLAQGTIIPGKCVLPGTTVRNTATDAALWRTQYRASPNGTTLIVDVHLLPTNDTSAIPSWYLKIDGVATAPRTHNHYCAADGLTEYYLGTAAVAGSFTDRMEVTVTAGVQHTVELWTTNKCRVLGWNLREKPRVSLTPGVDTVVDYSYLAPLAAMRTEDLQYMLQTALPAIVQKMRGVSLSWNVDDPATPVTVVGIGSSVTVAESLWANSAVTHRVPTQYRNSYMNEVLGTLSIPMFSWCYASVTAGAGTGAVVFHSEDGNVGGRNTAIAVTSGTPAFLTSTSWLTTAGAAGDPIQVRGYADVGTSIGVIAAGCFPLIGA